jgi:hypothetical protein
MSTVFGEVAEFYDDARTRAPLAARGLRPGGTLAVVGRKTPHRDSHLDQEIAAVFRGLGPDPDGRLPLPEWAVPEMRACGHLTDITTWSRVQTLSLSTARILRMQQSFGRSACCRRRRGRICSPCSARRLTAMAARSTFTCRRRWSSRAR